MSNAQLLEKPIATGDDAGELIMPNDSRFGIVSVNPGRVSGTPCFAGTRVPVKHLWDYLKDGLPLEEFLEGFLSVTREQAVERIGTGVSKFPVGTAAPVKILL